MMCACCITDVVQFSECSSKNEEGACKTHAITGCAVAEISSQSENQTRVLGLPRFHQLQDSRGFPN